LLSFCPEAGDEVSNIGDVLRQELNRTAAVDVAQHRGSDIDREKVISGGGVSTFDCTRSSLTHASVKKPTPAAQHTLAWNHLHRGSLAAIKDAISAEGESYENLAESTLASAARRRSSKQNAASVGRAINLSSPDSCS
jgi:hypothetical protein